MKEKIVAKRYAEAFLGYAKETFGFENAVKELKQIENIMLENPDFQEFLKNMRILYKEKCEVIEIVFKDFSNETRQFLELLLEKGRISNVMQVADYVRVKYSHGEAINALLSTTYPLHLDVITEIKDTMEKKFNRKINFYLEIDPHLMGGVKVRIGNTVIDGSLKRRLEELKAKLLTVNVNYASANS